jgi:peptidyl-prolyl cis-trans isomerase SurA
MKKTVLTLISLTLVAGSFAQNVFTYGKNNVSKEEFVRAFNKNPNITADRKKALKEYLDLYVNFKLKVQAAYADGLDKDATQQYELQNFRRQIADNIINDEANVKALVKEAFERSRKEIHLAQVFIEVPANSDTTDAYKRIQAAYKQLKEGKDFGTVAQEYAGDDATKQSKGDLGFITAFTLPYEFERIAYSLKPNSISAPVKTKLGYHIFKNIAERASLGYRKVAQILVAYPPNGSAADKAFASRKADSIYNLLQNGASFDMLASTVSNDLSSSNNKGELPEFTTGAYTPDFESVAFSLQKPGQLSKPFQTSYGFHILKLIEAKPAPSDINDAATFAALQEKVTKDNRMDLSKKQLINKKLAIIKYKPSPVKEKDLFVFTDSAIQKASMPTIKGINEKTVIFSFAKQNITAGDWVRFAKVAPQLPAYTSKLDYPSLFKEYIQATADEYYRNNLDAYNPNFAKQVNEFKEANLLFGIMEKKVWGKANADTTGLLNCYNQHKSKYTWSLSADAVIITCNSIQLADEMQQKIKANPADWRQITGSHGADVVADSGRYELGQLPVIDRTNFTDGLFTGAVKNETEGTYTFNYVIKVYREQGQRSFDDARGMVISDYQQVLEDNWIAELKKKYAVKINHPVFLTIK